MRMGLREWLALPGICGILSSVEIYVPASNSWSGAGSLLVPRSGASAGLLSNGRVLVAGGCSAVDADADCTCTTTETSAEIYDPLTGTSVLTGSMAAPRANDFPLQAY